MLHPKSSNKVALKASASRSKPGRTPTFTNDDLLEGVKPVAFDWNILNEKSDLSVQLPDSNDDGRLEKPRRALSAYNIFFHHQRDQIKKELAESSWIKENRQLQNATHRGKLLFAERARMVATRWKAMDKEVRAQYKELASRDKCRYQHELKEWRKLDSILHRFEEDMLLGSLIKTSDQKNTNEESYCEDQPHGIRFQQLINLCCETSSAPYGQGTVTPKTDTSMMQSCSNFVLTKKEGTVMEELNTSPAQEQLQHTLCVAEISEGDRLQELAEQLGNERVELLLQIFGNSSQEKQNVL